MIVLLLLGLCQADQMNRVRQQPDGVVVIYGNGYSVDINSVEIKIGPYDCKPLKSSITSIECKISEYQEGSFDVHLCMDNCSGPTPSYGTVNLTCPDRCDICNSPDNCLECSSDFYLDSGTCKSRSSLITPIAILTLLAVPQILYMEKYQKVFRILEVSGLSVFKVLNLVVFALNYESRVLFVAFCLSFFYEIFIYSSYLFCGGIEEIDTHKGAYRFMSPFVILGWYFNMFPLFPYFKKKDQHPLFINTILTANIHSAVSVGMCITVIYNFDSTVSVVLSCVSVYLYLLIPKVSVHSLEETNRGKLLNYLRHLGDIFTLSVTFTRFSDLFGCLVLFLVYRVFNSVFCLVYNRDVEVAIMNGQFKLNKRMKVSVLITNYIGKLTLKHKWAYLVVTLGYYCVLISLKIWLINHIMPVDYLSLGIDFLLLLLTWMELGVFIAYECSVFEETFSNQLQFRGRFKGWKSYLKIAVPLVSLIDGVTDIIYYFTIDFNSQELEEASLVFLVILPLVHFASTVVVGFVICKSQRRKGLAILVCAVPITVLSELKVIGIAVLFLQGIKQEFYSWIWIFLIVSESVFESVPQTTIQIINNQLTKWTAIAVLSVIFSVLNNLKNWFTIGYYLYTKSPVVQIREPGEVSEDELAAESQTLPEAFVFCFDNSEYARAQDYLPDRWQAQQEAAFMIATNKVESKPESTLGVVSMAGNKSRNDLTSSITQAFSILRYASVLQGKIDLEYGLETAKAILKKKPQKEHLQRIIVFVCSPVETRSGKLSKLGKTLRKNKIALDLVCFGNRGDADKLRELVKQTNFQENSHLILVSHEERMLSDSLLNTPVIHGYTQPQTNTLENREDSEYTKAIKESLEQAKKDQELFELDEEQLIHQAIQLSIKENFQGENNF